MGTVPVPSSLSGALLARGFVFSLFLSGDGGGGGGGGGDGGDGGGGGEALAYAACLCNLRHFLGDLFLCFLENGALCVLDFGQLGLRFCRQN